METPFTIKQLSTAGVADYPPGATFGPRRMRDYELVWLVEGSAEYRVDDVVYPAPEGAMVLCRPGTVDAFTWDPKRRTRHAYVHFDVPPPRRSDSYKDWPVVRQRIEGDVLVPLFQHLLTWANTGDVELSRQTLALMLRMFIHDQRVTHDLPPQVQPDPVDRAIAHVYASLDADATEAITLDDLASAACVTAEHLCRLFQKSMDRTPMECVRMARLDRSVVLLTRSNFSVGQIAGMCGFASQFHFSRRFKEAFGATPTQVRSRVRTGETPPLPKLLRWRAMPLSRKNQA